MKPRRLLTVITAVSTTFITILMLLSIAVVDAVGSSATLAIVQSSNIICGIRLNNKTIQCVQLEDSQPFDLPPKASFESVAGGRDALCGLRNGGDAVIYWNASNSSHGAELPHRRIYRRKLAVAVDELTVGEDHIAAVDRDRTRVMWWRQDASFGGNVYGEFRSLSSGAGFSCAVAGAGAVRCWGSNGTGIEAAFKNVVVSSIVAGESHVCGLSTAGDVVCGGANDFGQLSPPPESPPFEFRSLALGSRHTCALRRRNGTLVCWGAGAGKVGYYNPAGDTAFMFAVSGGDLTCGLTSADFSVLCWSANESNPAMKKLPLSTILPGICVSNQSSCECGVLEDSLNYCSNSRIICKQCDARPLTSPSPSSSSRIMSRGWMFFVIVGSIGGFAGTCTIIFWLWFGICGNKKVHNSVQPTVTSTKNIEGSSAVNSSAAGTIPFASQTISMSKFFRQNSKLMRPQRSGPSSFKDGAEKFSFGELAAATMDFSGETKIGAGSFGTVYMGKLIDGREVAIKRGELEPKAKKFQEKESAFHSELAFLSRLHHKHLVALVGYCKEKDERMLVYEYMKNGALHDHLHSTNDHESLILNSWKARIKVLLDAARGIDYLHNYAVPQIIHRDIKSSNILLDENWVAKVSDFGLSLMGTDSTSGHLSMRAAGTVGYMDPEYYALHHLTVKSDVYGFGVVMLEVLTGKRAIFKNDENLTSIIDYAVPFIAAGEVDKILDTRLGMPDLHEAEAVELTAYTATHCVRVEGRERPNMTDIVANLEGALAMCQGSHGSISSVSLSLASLDRD